jgi:type II secretory pathway pseudopilin PulG
MSPLSDCSINRKRDGKKAGRSCSKGFTMLELMISSAMFIVVLLAIFKLLESSRDVRFTTGERAALLRAARTAVDTMGHDIVNSGVGYPDSGAKIPQGLVVGILGLPAYTDSDANYDWITPIVAGDNINAVNSVNTDQISLIFVDSTFNGGSPLTATSATTGSSWMTITTTATPLVNNSVCTAGDLFLVTGSNGSALGWLTGVNSTDKLVFANTDPLNINQPSQTNGVLQSVLYPASVMKVKWIRYYVDSTGTLFRREYGAPSTRIGGGATTTVTKYLDSPIADNVKDLQIKYTLLDNTVVTNPTAAQYASIRQVTVTITINSPDIDRRSNTRETLTLTSTFDARNLGYVER